MLDELAGRGLGTVKFHHGIDFSLERKCGSLQKLSPLFFLRWEDYWKLCQEKMALGKRASEVSEAISNWVEFADLSVVAQRIIRDGLRRVIRKEWLVRLAEFLAWKRVLEDLPIKGVLLTEDFLPSERALTLTAKDGGIPTWIVQHGLAIHPDGRGFIPVLADKIFCFGESAVSFFAEFGLPRTRMEITGRPLYDRWVPAKQEGFKKCLSKSFLFLGQPLYKENLCSYQSYISTIEMAAALGREKGIKVRLRPHPREAASAHEAIAGKYEGVEVVPRRESIIESLRTADTVATCFSTGGLEALLMGKHLICLNPGKVPEAELFAKNLGALICRNKSDLILAMRSVAESSETSEADLRKQRDKILRDNLCLLDGMATRRIADHILKDLPN